MHSWPRRILWIGAALVLVSAVGLAVGVIPPVRADTYPLATPWAFGTADRAVRAFWVIVALDVVVAGAAVASGRFGYRVLLGLVGILALQPGLGLIDAATAYAAHGAGMHRAVVVLWVCVGLDLVGGLSMVASAVIPRRYWGDRA